MPRSPSTRSSPTPVAAGEAAALAPMLTPHGRLTLAPSPEAPPLDEAVATQLGAAFTRGSGHGLLRLGGAVATGLPPALAYWRELGSRYVTAVCTLADVETRRAPYRLPPPPDDELDALAAAAPPMVGGEYVTVDRLRALWDELDAAFAAELADADGVADLLRRLDPSWHVVGRVHFNLAENRRDEEAPFAFLATYTASLSAKGRAQHLPLGEALREYAGPAKKQQLLSLLLPVQRAAKSCAWLEAMVDGGELFHPLRWTVAEAVQLLGDLPKLEAAGVVVRVPAAWRGNRPPRPRVTATVGDKKPAGLGQAALLDFRVDVTIDGEPLTAQEVEALLASTEGMALLRGRWVEVDRDRLRAMLDELARADEARVEGMTLAEALRMIAGAEVEPDDDAPALDPDWSKVVAGPWLAETLRALRSPDAAGGADPGKALQATLRPYQRIGVRWLHLLAELGLGACLADDMGLGKTIQVLSLLLIRGRGAGGRPSLLVAPASLLANWAAELERFAPSLRFAVAHPSALTAAELATLPDRLGELDLVITSYGSALRLPWLAATAWDLAILDEAQAIKNAGTKQAKAVKKLDARARIALTGTPIENRLGDLWSIFDFLNPGLLGSAKQFTSFTKRLADRPHVAYAPLRDLVRPYILRRLKSDPAVIADLPDKTEVVAYCPLSRRQAALYQQAVDEMAARLRSSDGIQRRGVVLAFLMRFKQICNHPAHWLGGDGAWAEADSGKLGRLRDLAETIAARQEKALVFTQFREATEPLAGFLADVFGRPGLVLHGDTPVKERAGLVRRFQDDEQVPFFVLSLKAGGSGLNLTAASHVIHFDRWWNPAVEAQATDRAFRIGQTRNVLVHKLVCRGTVEDKIDQLIESKRKLADEILTGGAEPVVTELADDELLRLVSLDLRAALEEG